MMLQECLSDYPQVRTRFLFPPLAAYELHYSGVLQDPDYSTINAAQNRSDFIFTSGFNKGNVKLSGSEPFKFTVEVAVKTKN